MVQDKIEEFEDMKINLLCHQSKIFRNMYMSKFVFID